MTNEAYVAEVTRVQSGRCCIHCIRIICIRSVRRQHRGGSVGEASAASTTFNPFVTNAPDGQTATFGVLAQGNLVLNNSHNQSAMAAFGTFTKAHQNNGNARMGSEAVPTIDGVPLRLLAQKFAGGNGLFEVTQDYVKFGDI